jgi:hypothetical protein
LPWATKAPVGFRRRSGAGRTARQRSLESNASDEHNEKKLLKKDEKHR